MTQTTITIGTRVHRLAHTSVRGPRGLQGDVTPEVIEARDAAQSAAVAAAGSAALAEQARLLGATIGFATRAAMDADLAHPEGTLALVTNDPDPENNVTYRKTGASGSGSWVQSADRVTGLGTRISTAESRIGSAEAADTAISVAENVSSALNLVRDKDLISHFSGLELPDEIYVRSLVRNRTALRRLCIAFRRGTTITEFAFVTDDDGLMLMKECHVGPADTVVVAGSGVPVVRTGSFSPEVAPDTHYANAIGATISGAFEGVGLLFNTYTDNRGGLWEFVIDGGSPIPVSVWSSALNSNAQITVAQGLPDGPHTFIATYVGADPNHTPSSGGPRGWSKMATPVAPMENKPSLTFPDYLIQPELVGSFTITYPITYTTQVGAEMRFSFTGPVLEFQTYMDNSGGMWEFVIDGGSPIQISTYSPSGTTDWLVVASGLSSGSHDVVATFVGADPLNPPSSGEPRGWLYYLPDWPTTFRAQHVQTGTQELMTDDIHEWAIVACPADEPSWTGWSPRHGAATVSRNVSQKVIVDGDEIDVALLPTHYVPCRSVQIVQSYDNYAELDTGATKRMWRGRVKHQTTARGSIAVMHSLMTDRDTIIATGYLAMMGGGSRIEEAGNNEGEVVTPATPVSGEEAVNYAQIGASDSYLAIGSRVAVLRTTTPAQVWQDDLTPNTRRFFVNTRAGMAVKTYMQGIDGGRLWPAGRLVQTLNEYWAGER